jgi:hypothetical protein
MKRKQFSAQTAEGSLINVGNERLAGIFRWILLIFALIMNNFGDNPFNVSRVNGVLALWGAVSLTTLAYLFLQRHPGRFYAYMTTAVDMLVGAMITYLTGGYSSAFSMIFFLVIIVSALRFGVVGAVVCAAAVSALYLCAGAVGPLRETGGLELYHFRAIILGRLFVFFVVAMVATVMARAFSQHRETVTRELVERQLMTEINMALANAIEAKDAYTRGHSERLAKLSGALAMRLGLPSEEVTAVRLGAILHDVGKIGIPDRILRQSLALSDDDRAWVRRHPQIGADIIGPVAGLQRVAPLIRHHHEKWDGSGYPDGLKGEAIPLGARIISVTDAFEAMVADRSYRASMGLPKAVDELKRGAGSHFDPKIVEAFLNLLETDTIHLPLPTRAVQEQQDRDRKGDAPPLPEAMPKAS